MMGRGALTAICLTLAACAPAPVLQKPTPTKGRPTVAVSAVVPAPANAEAFAQSFLNAIQPQSFALRAELCGYFYVAANGQPAATPPVRGSFARCDTDIPRPGQRIFASYHTHGAYGAAYDNEVPSPTDMRSDFEFGLDGYISTPGGRVWHLDYDTQTARQLCGLGCVARDPGFRPRDENSIPQVYTLATLNARANGN